MVWNSDQGYVGERPKGPAKKKPKKNRGGSPEAGFPKDGVTRIRRETGGRGGKTVTVLYGVPGSPDERRQLFKELKKICGSGGADKTGRLEIQGDHRDTIMAILNDKGISAKATGG